VSGLSGVTAIAAGGYHNLALKADGSLVTWGRNFYGQLGDGTTSNRLSPVAVSGLSGVTALAGGWLHSLALGGPGALQQPTPTPTATPRPPLRTWTGAVSGAWANPANWGGTAPGAGDDLVFPVGAANPTMTNDLPAFTGFNLLTFQGSGYTIDGNGVGLTSGISTTNALGTNTITVPLRLTGGATFSVAPADGPLLVTGGIDLTGNTLVVDGGGRLRLDGAISGAGGLIKNGNG